MGGSVKRSLAMASPGCGAAIAKACGLDAATRTKVLSVSRKGWDMHLFRQRGKSALLAISIVCAVCANSVMAQEATSNRKQALEVAAFDRQRIFKLADQALGVAPISITQFPAKLSEG
ncbi:MAG: hypothetical protein EHM35_09735, partial [Planctomycetaceae bacterium]